MDEVLKFWPILVTLVVCLIWCIRLEAKVVFLEKILEKKLDEDLQKNKTIEIRFDNLQTMMTTVLQSLSKLEGIIEVSFKGE